MHEQDDEPEDSAPSKSARKREMLGLQALAEALSELPPSQLERIDLPAELRDGVVAARRMKRGAFRRHLRFLAHLIDERTEATALRAALEAQRAPGRAETAQLHRLERWRDRLLAGGDEAVEAFMAEHPGADRQHLRNLVRSAVRAAERLAEAEQRAAAGERETSAAHRTSRALFRCLRDSVGAD